MLPFVLLVGMLGVAGDRRRQESGPARVARPPRPRRRADGAPGTAGAGERRRRRGRRPAPPPIHARRRGRGARSSWWGPWRGRRGTNAGTAPSRWTRRSTGSAASSRSPGAGRPGTGGRSRWSCRTGEPCPWSGTCSLRNSSVWRPASSRVSVDASIAASRPDRVCISRTTGSIASSWSAAGVHDQVGALGDHGQLVVGDQGGDLHDDVAGGVEPGHLEVHPYEHPVDATGGFGALPGLILGAGRVADDRVMRCSRCPSSASTPTCPRLAIARHGDAGADLHAREDAMLAPGGGRALVPTGVALAIPPGYAGFVQPRSGLALRHGVTCLNTPGLIDAGYRDELRVLLVNTDPSTPYEVHRGDRIAQLVIQAVEEAKFVDGGRGGACPVPTAVWVASATPVDDRMSSRRRGSVMERLSGMDAAFLALETDHHAHARRGGDGLRPLAVRGRRRHADPVLRPAARKS